MRFACWINKATGIHSEYVIFIAFPQQQWLRERASILRHPHITYLPSAGQEPNTGLSCLTVEVSNSYTIRRAHTHTHTHKNTVGLPLNEWSAHRTGRYLHNTKTQDTNTHAIIAIRTRDPSKWAAADLRLRPYGRRVLLQTRLLVPNNYISVPSCEGVSKPTVAVCSGGRAPVRIGPYIPQFRERKGTGTSCCIIQ